VVKVQELAGCNCIGRAAVDCAGHLWAKWSHSLFPDDVYSRANVAYRFVHILLYLCCDHFLPCLILFVWLKKPHALVDAASLLVLQQTIVTVPERLHLEPKLRPARVTLPLLPNLVKILHKESDKEQILVLYHLSKTTTEGPSTRLARLSMRYIQ
jgi:hypothetical protein